MPGQKETCSSTPSSSDILSRLQEFAFQKRNDTRQLTYESTLGSVENKSGKYEGTGFTQTDTQKNSTEVKVESNKLLNDHKGASLKNYVDSGMGIVLSFPVYGPMLFANTVDCICVPL